jgi:hypothetical protein
MRRSWITASIVGWSLVAAAPKARAVSAIGAQAGLYTPTREARDLIDAQWVLGLRFLLPPYSPIGLLQSRSLHLDLGLDLALDKARQLTVENLDTQLFNLTAVYRYSIPIGSSGLAYVGLGGRVSAVWGELSQGLRDGSLFGHLRGSMSVCGGIDYALTPGLLLDVRLSTGILGFTSWEAMAGLLLGG